MQRTGSIQAAGALAAMAIGLALAGPAFGLVLFPTDEAAPALHPSDAVIGQWYEPSGALKGSCVAIGSSYVLTTRHQGGDVGYSVTIGGVNYPVLETFEDDSIDIRIARIAAHLTYTIAPYTDNKELGKTLVLGGFGRVRGADITSGGLTYGYQWGDPSPAVRWGANRVDGISTGSYRGLTSDVLQGHFDALGLVNHRASEAAPAEFDSGGGWFIDVSTGGTGDWRLAGLSRFTERAGATWFKNPDGTSHPDVFDGIRVRSYAGWINGVMNPSTWVGGSGGWSASAQWSAAGKPNGADKWAVFGDFGHTALAVTLDQDTTVGTLRFDGYTDYTVGGPSRLTFSVTSGTAGIEGNRLLDPLATGSVTIAVPVTLASSLLVDHSSGGALTLSGVVSGEGGLTKDKSGTLVLANTNTYSGGTVLKAGTLRATVPGAFGPGPITLAGGTLDLRQDASVSFTNSFLVSGDTIINLDHNTAGAGRTVTLGSLTVVGDWKLTTKSASGYGLAVSGATSFQGTIDATVEATSADVVLSGGVSLLAGSLTKTGPKALTLAGPQSWGAGTALNASGGTVRLNADIGASALYNVTLSAAGAGTRAEFDSTQHLAALSLTGGAVGSMPDGGGKVLVTKALTIDPAVSKLDLAANALIVKYTGGAPYAPSPELKNIKAWVKAGYNGMTWTGNGLTSRTAVADPVRYAIGYAQNDQLFLPFDHFAGEPVDGKTVVAKLTYAGDMNLDGVVDDLDVAIIGLYYDGGAVNTHYWNEGDVFGYDGYVDDNDVAVVGLMYGSGYPPNGDPLGGAGAGAAGAGAGVSWALADSACPAGGSPVPEPATLALILLGGLALLRRRV
jgi:autotransporter-associated beta strand protein